MYISSDIYDPLSRFVENLKKVWTGFWNALFSDSCGYVEGYYLISFIFFSFFQKETDSACVNKRRSITFYNARLPLSYSLLQTPQFT